MIPMSKLGAIIAKEARAQDNASYLGGTGVDRMSPRLAAAAQKLVSSGKELSSPLTAALMRVIQQQKGR